MYCKIPSLFSCNDLQLLVSRANPTHMTPVPTPTTKSVWVALLVVLYILGLIVYILGLIVSLIGLDLG